jgi:hypothetical protein
VIKLNTPGVIVAEHGQPDAPALALRRLNLHRRLDRQPRQALDVRGDPGQVELLEVGILQPRQVLVDQGRLDIGTAPAKLVGGGLHRRDRCRAIGRCACEPPRPTVSGRIASSCARVSATPRSPSYAAQAKE